MKCSNCNADIATNAKFCSKCGVAVQQASSGESFNSIEPHLNEMKEGLHTFWDGLDKHKKSLYTRLVIGVSLFVIAYNIKNGVLISISCILLLSVVISSCKNNNTAGKTKKKENVTLIQLSHPINLRYKYVKQFLGKYKLVPTSLDEQKKLKSVFLKIYPDNIFYDDLNEENSNSSDGTDFILRKTEQPINLRIVYKQTSNGRRKEIETSTAEQKRLKKAILMIYPDNMFYDYLYEANSVKCTTNRRDDKDTNYDWVINMSTEDIKEYFSNDNDKYDGDDDDCDCEGGDDCDCMD